MHICCCFLEVTKAVPREGMTALVKVSALLCFALVGGSASLAQQPTEWRPSIAEDNKAATLDDTLKFVVGTANDPALNQIYVPEEKDNSAAFDETFVTASTAKCSIEWGGVLVLTHHRYGGITDRWPICPGSILLALR